MSDVLEFDGIELSYGTRRILSGVYVKCSVGEVVGILGRNGSGKSSLFKVVFGTLRAEQSIRINGTSVPPDFIRKRLIGYLPQAGLIPPHITVSDALRMYNIKADLIVEPFPGMAQHLSHKPRDLSGGYRRLLELMLILYAPSRFCLLDEPFTGIMPVHVEAIRKILSQVKETKGIILTDHLYRNVLDIANRLYLLADGSIYPVTDRQRLVEKGYLAPG